MKYAPFGAATPLITSRNILHVGYSHVVTHDTWPKPMSTQHVIAHKKDKKSKVHPCTGTEALYRSYGP